MSENFNDKDKNELIDEESAVLDDVSPQDETPFTDNVKFVKEIFKIDDEGEVETLDVDDVDDDAVFDEEYNDDLTDSENIDSDEDEYDLSEEDDDTQDEINQEPDDEADSEATEESEEETEEESLDNKVLRKVNKKVSEFNKKDSNKRIKIISISVAVALLAILVFTDIIPILPNAYNRFYVGNKYDIGETQGSVFDKFGENVLYAGNGVVMSFGPDMSCNFKKETPIGTPKLETSGNNALVYYMNSNDALLITDNNNTRSIKTDYVITCATVNSRGYYGLVTKEPGYESYVEVFNSSGTSIYKYHTNNPIVDITVSDNGKSMIAASYDLTDSEISGKLLFIDLTSDKPGKEVVLKSNLISEVNFINKDTAVAFGDMFTVAYSGNGAEKWRIKYDTRTAKSYDVSSTGDIAFIFDRYSSELSESTVVIYGTDGKLKGKYESKDNVKYVSANNDYFLLSLDRQTVLLDDEAKAVKKKNTSKDFRRAVLYSNYNFAFSITDGVSEIMSVKH